MPVFVMDCCAIIAYLKNEDGADEVQRTIEEGENDCIIHIVNLVEVYKHYCKFETEAAGDQAIQTIITTMGIEVCHDTKESLWKMVGRQWAKITSTVRDPKTGGCHQIPMYDCFAIALALDRDGTVVTSDAEFQHVKDAGICKVHFYRPPGKRYDYSKKSAGS